MRNQIDIIPVDSKYREAIISLLQSEGLPVEDLPPVLQNFFIAMEKGLAIGAVGLEIYESSGLLRSLVVKPAYRKMKIAAGLIDELETFSKNSGLKSIYLLTETAQDYFSKRGYKIIQRENAPESLQQSSEFSHVCPATAILMKKDMEI